MVGDAALGGGAAPPSQVAPLARLTLRLLLSAVIVWVLFTRIPVTEVGRVLRSVNGGFVALAIALVPLFTYVGAAQQRVLTMHQGLTLSTPRILEINVAAQFYGLFLPGYLAGGVLRWYRMSRGGRAVGALAAIAFNRLLETLVILLLGVAMWLLAQPPWVDARFTAIMLAALAGVAILVVALFDGRLASFMGARFASGEWRLLPHAARAKLAESIRAAERFGTMPAGDVRRLAVLVLLRQALEFTSFVLMAWAVGIHLPLPALGWIRSFMALALMLPIAFAGIGVREATLLLALQPYGVGAESAIALAALLLARYLLAALGGGLWELKGLLFGHRASSDAQPPIPSAAD
jgi:uncharacterized membrane protein YbhN (UPF0104 family)